MLAAQESLPWHNAGRTCCEQDGEEVFWVSFSFFFFFFPVFLFDPFFPAPACRSVAGAVHGACTTAAPQMSREQSWGPARCGVMLGAGWAVPIPCGAPLCREQGDNKQ